MNPARWTFRRSQLALDFWVADSEGKPVCDINRRYFDGQGLSEFQQIERLSEIGGLLAAAPAMIALLKRAVAQDSVDDGWMADAKAILARA